MVPVRDSAAWTVGRICDQVPVSVLNDEVLLALLQALVAGLDGEPRVATNICWVGHTPSSCPPRDRCRSARPARPRP